MVELLQYDFFLYALIAGVTLSLAAAPLGCFVVWRRMAYFGDALAHSALLGVVGGLFWQVPMILAVIPVAILMAWLLSFARDHSRLAADSLLGITAHSSLALGIILMALVPDLQVDLMAYLFGDILSVGFDDLVIIYALTLFVLLMLRLHWRSFLLITLNEELAAVKGIKVNPMRMILLLLIALTIALSIKLVGLLLITSLLILPAASARLLSDTPLQMVGFASFIAIAIVSIGLTGSMILDTPSGPSIVVLGGGLLLVISLLNRLRKRY